MSASVASELLRNILACAAPARYAENMTTITLPTQLQQQIFEHLRSTYPNEGGGFLFGAVEPEGITIAGINPVTNVFAAEEQYHRYAMTPQDWAHQEDAAEERGLTLVGYYHSHPDSPAIPSIFDRDHALPNFVYIITQVQDGEAVDMRVWRLKDDRTEFDAGNLIVS